MQSVSRRSKRSSDDLFRKAGFPAMPRASEKVVHESTAVDSVAKEQGKQSLVKSNNGRYLCVILA